MRLLDKKIQKVINLQTTKPEVIEALDSFSEFFTSTDNAIDARKGMRLTLEGIGIDISNQFSSELQYFFQVLDTFSTSLKEIEETCNNIDKRLTNVWKDISPVYEYINDTKDTKNVVMERKKAIQDFLNRYTLSDAEESILLNEKNLNENNYEYFTIQEKAIQIRKSCDVLLQDPYCILSCTVQLLERVSRQQEDAYKLLFQWIQKQLDQSHTNGYIFDINDNRFHFFQRAFITLKQRQSYFDHCLDLLNNARKDIMTKRFIDMQRGWNQGKKTGLYVSLLSDILASTHQWMGSEEEFYQLILTEYNKEVTPEEPVVTNTSLEEFTPLSPLASSPNSVDSSENTDTNFNLKPSKQDKAEEMKQLLKKSLDVVFSGIISPLTAMIDDIINYEPKIQELFSLHQLISFYIYSYEKLLSKDSPLIIILKQSENKIWQTICTLMANKINKSNYNTLLYTMDNSPLPVVQEYISIMTNSLTIFNTCLLSESEKEECFNQLASSSIPLLLNVCQKNFKSMDGSNSDTPIFMVNTLEQIRKTLVTYSFTVEWVVKCTDELENWLDKIIQEKIKDLLKQSNLLDVIQYLETKPKDHPLSAYPNATAADIEKDIQLLVSKMYSSIAPEYNRITQKVRERARLEASRSIADIYQRLYDAVHDPVNGYLNPDNIMIHTPKQIRTLLDCEN